MNQPPNQGDYNSPKQGDYGAQPGQGQYNVQAQNPQYGAHPQQGYPQQAQPGQYSAQYPQQYPQGRPPRTGPSKGLGFLKLMIGMCLGLGFVGGLLYSGHEGIAAGAIMGTLMGLGLRWVVTGGANLAGKKIPLLPSLAIIFVGTAAGALAGPPASEGMWKSQEESNWNKLSSRIGPDDHVSRWEWKREYFDYIPTKYHREAAPGMYKFLEVREAIRQDDLVKLRKHVYDLAVNYKDDENYKLAFDTASGELQKRYDAVLEKLATPGQAGEDAEFAVDEDLRTAFKTILSDLAKAPTPDVYLAFDNKSQLEAPTGHEQGLADEVAWVKSNGMTVMDPPLVIKPGDAFSSSYDMARRNSFMKVSDEEFKDAFDSSLFTLKPVEAPKDRDDNFVFEVSSTIRRTDTYFHYTSRQPDGSNTLNGFLFAIEVDWELKLFDRKGELMYERKVTTAPGSQLSIKPQASDPDWAVYSILMDSAYYNYSREVVGSFGLEPPDRKTVFAYSSYGVTGG